MICLHPMARVEIPGVGMVPRQLDRKRWYRRRQARCHVVAEIQVMPATNRDAMRVRLLRPAPSSGTDRPHWLCIVEYLESEKQGF